MSLGRPVLLDDPTLAPLAYSRQWGIDNVRSESILGRGVQPGVREALVAQGIATARDVIHTRGDPDLNMEDRVCLPVREGGEIVGYLWLLDPDSTLTEADFLVLRKTARELASSLGSHPRPEVKDEADLLADLRSSEPATRGRAVERLVERGFQADERVVLCLLASAQEAGESALEIAAHVARRLSVGHAIVAGVPEGAALLASLGDPVLRVLAPDEIGGWVRAITHDAVFVGLSAACAPTELPPALRQAAIALRVARATTRGGACSWARLGADRLVAQLPPQALDDVPEPLLRLLRDEPALATTLATFLDTAGNVKATAEALSLRRSGLYYRLGRIAELTGMDLASGEDRLLAQLALRLSAMAAVEGADRQA